MIKSIFYAFIFILVFSLQGCNQPSNTYVDTLDRISLLAQSPYKFIQYEKNVIQDFSDDSLVPLINLFDSLLINKKEKLRILHMGDSHLQADYFSGKIRKLMQENMACSDTLSRGFVFPYEIAKTNTPFNYYTEYSGKWEGCRSVEKNKDCELGLSGISVQTEDSVAYVKIILRKSYQNFNHNLVKVFHNKSSGYKIKVCNTKYQYISYTNEKEGYTTFTLSEYIDTLCLKMIKVNNQASSFVLHGILLENSSYGIEYDAVGVNGASVDSYLRSGLFSHHLNIINPDWIIISLGTNDGYSEGFNPAYFNQNYQILIDKIKAINPHVQILLSTPGDSYRYEEEVNTNMTLVTKEIYKLAKKNKCMLWDWFSVMGGENSIAQWYEQGLTAEDKLHFNKKGYFLQGDLFFNAFLKAYNLNKGKE